MRKDEGSAVSLHSCVTTCVGVSDSGDYYETRASSVASVYVPGKSLSSTCVVSGPQAARCASFGFTFAHRRARGFATLPRDCVDHSLMRSLHKSLASST